MPTKAELQAENDALRAENERLRSQSTGSECEVVESVRRTCVCARCYAARARA